MEQIPSWCRRGSVLFSKCSAHNLRTPKCRKSLICRGRFPVSGKSLVPGTSSGAAGFSFTPARMQMILTPRDVHVWHNVLRERELSGTTRQLVTNVNNGTTEVPQPYVESVGGRIHRNTRFIHAGGVSQFHADFQQYEPHPTSYTTILR